MVWNEFRYSQWGKKYPVEPVYGGDVDDLEVGTKVVD
jgi:hypothetical protein